MKNVFFHPNSYFYATWLTFFSWETFFYFGHMIIFFSKSRKIFSLGRVGFYFPRNSPSIIFSPIHSTSFSHPPTHNKTFPPVLSHKPSKISLSELSWTIKTFIRQFTVQLPIVFKFRDICPFFDRLERDPNRFFIILHAFLLNLDGKFEKCIYNMFVSKMK